MSLVLIPDVGDDLFEAPLTECRHAVLVLPPEVDLDKLLFSHSDEERRGASQVLDGTGNGQGWRQRHGEVDMFRLDGDGVDQPTEIMRLLAQSSLHDVRPLAREQRTPQLFDLGEVVDTFATVASGQPRRRYGYNIGIVSRLSGGR